MTHDALLYDVVDIRTGQTILHRKTYADAVRYVQMKHNGRIPEWIMFVAVDLNA